MRRCAATAIAACVVVLCGGIGLASPAPNPAAVAALHYVLRHEQSDGGFPLQAGQKASTMSSGWAAMAIGAARQSGLIPSAGDAGTATITYLERTVKQESGAGAIERTVVALRSLGQQVTDVDGIDLVTRLQHLIGSNGSVQDKTNLTTWEVLALRAARVAIPARTVRWLEDQQDRDGGFNFATHSNQSGTSDPDDTGAALEALAAAGAIHSQSAVVSRAIGYLHRDQNRDGGFGYPRGAASNAESTAWALQGLIAVGVKPAAFHRKGGRNPSRYLLALTRASGEIAYSSGTYQTPVWTTAEVLPALLDQPYPIDVAPKSAPRASRHASGQAPTAGQPLAGNGGALKSVQPDIALSVGRLIVSLHSLL
jgi:Squalene-hopene cyclase C-terminal domain/Prenyltransferase and squalene oxidase repeat